MAKVLPAGANVNLGLGEDPMDRLLKTIQVASQAQGVMNQATLQRDRREAIKLESMQKMMAYQLSNMDSQNTTSIEGTKNSLVELRDQFKKENPRLSEDIDVFYGATYASQIKPIEEVHTRFNRIKDRLHLSVENLNQNVQALPDNTIIASDELKFKDELAGLQDVLNEYKINSGEFSKFLPDLNSSLYSEVVAANNLATVLPGELKGLFDDYEQDLAGMLGRGEISLEYYKAAHNKYFTATQGKVNSKIIPRISGEINALWKDYQEPNAFKEAIASGTVPLQSDAIKNQKHYYDEASGIYYFEGQPLNSGKYGDKTYDDKNPDEWLAKAKENAQKTLENIYLNDIKDKITEQDALYKEYVLGRDGEASSYATVLTNSQKWPWQEATSGGFIEDILDGDKGKDSIQLENLDDFTKLGINVPENLTLDDLNSMEAEITKMAEDESDGGNFIKLQSLTRANNAIGNAKAKLEASETKKSETDESGMTYSSITDFVIDYGKEYGDEAAGVATIGVGAYNIPKVNKAIKLATSYITKTLDLPSDSVIDLFNDADFKQVSKQLASIDKRILAFKKTLPEGASMDFKVGSKNFITYKALLQEKKQIVENSKHAKNLITKMEAGHFPDMKVDVDIVKPEPFNMKKPPKGAGAEAIAEYNKAKKLHQIKMREYNLNLSSSKSQFRKKIMNFLIESDKWDVNAIKRTVTKSVKEAYRTPKDLYNVLTQGAVKVGPLDAAIHAWFLMPEDAEIGYKVSAAGVAGMTTKGIINYAKKKGISPFLNDKKLTSKLGKFLIKQAPGTMAKMGFKGVAGAVAAGSGIGSAISAAMLAWTLNDIRILVKQFPEIRQMLSESIARQESGELDMPNKEETEQPPVINEQNWMKPYSQQGE